MTRAEWLVRTEEADPMMPERDGLRTTVAAWPWRLVARLHAAFVRRRAARFVRVWVEKRGS